MAEEKATSRGADFGQGSVTAITVTAAADSVVRALKVPRGATRLYFEVKNSHGATAFDQFTVKRRMHASGNYETLASIAGDYSSPQIPILTVQGAPVTLAAAASVHIEMDVTATDTVQILASGAAGASTAEIYWRLQ